jgi:protein gp37
MKKYLSVEKYTPEKAESMAKNPAMKKNKVPSGPSVEFSDFSWNPIVGCTHGCSFCYAETLTNRMKNPEIWPTDFRKPVFYPGSKITGKPKDGKEFVFICSMADLLCDGVPDEWISAVFDEVKRASVDGWRFISLTKNPERYLDLDLPESLIVGASAYNQEGMDRITGTFKKLDHKHKLLVLEPLTVEVDVPQDLGLEWLIVGGLTGTGAKGTPQAMASNVAGFKGSLWIKKNSGLNINRQERPIFK